MAWGDSWSSSGFTQPHYLKPPKPRKKKKDSGHLGSFGEFFANLGGDVRDAAVGLPMGFINIGRAVGTGDWGELGKMGKVAARATWHTWSPLVRGDVGEFAHNFKEHPLAPLLDIVSLITIPIGGVGVGVKGASTVSRAAGLTKTTAEIEKVAKHFRPQMRSLTTVRGLPRGTKAYASNPGSRAMTKGVEKFMTKTHLVSEADRHRRWVGRKQSKRAMAASASQQHQLIAARKLIKDPTMSATDIALKLDPHIRLQFIDVAEKISPKNLLTGKGPKVDGDWMYVAKNPKAVRFPTGKSSAEMSVWLERQAHRNTTTKSAEALRDGDGNYLLVRNSSVRNYVKEASNSYKALETLAYSPLKVWKWMVLATAPRYFINNVIGNTLMFAVSQNPVDTLRNYSEALGQIAGKRTAAIGLAKTEKAIVKLQGDWIDHHYLDALQGFSGEVGRDLGRKHDWGGPVRNKAVDIAKTGLYGVTHQVSDLLVRRAVVNSRIRRTNEYKEAYDLARAEGMGRDSAHNFAGEFASSAPHVRDWMTEQIDNVLGDYAHLNKAERVLKSVVPFYTWDRAILRHTKHMIQERPGVAVAAQQISNQGVEATETWLGDIPRFLKGAVPLEALGLAKKGGRAEIVTTQGLNPYSTVPDVLDFMRSITGLGSKNLAAGEVLGSQINPFIAAAVEQTTGQSLLSGARIPQRSGIVEATFRNTTENTPLFKLFQTAIQGPPKSSDPKKPFLYLKDMEQQLSGFLGAPIKRMSKEKAGELARRERDELKPTRRTRQFNPAAFSF